MSVSLALTQPDPTKSGKSPLDYWRQTFSHPNDEGKTEKDLDKPRTKEEERESTPPREISGVGDAAYWVGNAVGGALYVLKNDVFIRVSVGGGDKEQVKIDKSKALAEKALERL